MDQIERCKALAEVAPVLAETLRQVRQVMLVEHGLNPEYGWKDYVEKEIDPALAAFEKAKGE